MLILGIESSCDETGVALIDSQQGLLAHRIHTQIDMHRAFGGVVPELASRDHIRRVLVLIDEVLANAGKTRADLSAIAVTEGWPARCLSAFLSRTPSATLSTCL